MVVFISSGPLLAQTSNKHSGMTDATNAGVGGMVQNFDNQYDNDDMNEASLYYCNSCKLPVWLKRRDPVICTHIRPNSNNEEKCYRTDLKKMDRPGWLFRVAR